MKICKTSRGWTPFDIILGFDTTKEAASFEQFLETVLRIPVDTGLDELAYNMNARQWATLLMQMVERRDDFEEKAKAPKAPEGGS